MIEAAWFPVALVLVVVGTMWLLARADATAERQRYVACAGRLALASTRADSVAIVNGDGYCAMVVGQARRAR